MKHCYDCKNESSRPICYGESRCAYCREMEDFEPREPTGIVYTWENVPNIRDVAPGNTPESIQFLKEGEEDAD